MEKNYKKILKKTKLATLFNINLINDSLIVLQPERIIIGNTMDNSKYFLDLGDGEVYKNVNEAILDKDEMYAYYDAHSIDKLLKKYNVNTIKGIINKKTDLLSNNVYYIDDSMQVKSMPKKLFSKKYDFCENSISQEDILNELMNINNEENNNDSLEEKKEINFPNINSVYLSIKENVISQDDAIKKILTAIYKNFLINDSRFKTNIILYGNSGMGKTEILRQIRDIIKLPIVIEDMNNYTQAGYTGHNVEELLKNLYIESDYNLDLAERGILCLDEIDKKVPNSSFSNDIGISNTAVLNSLLKIIEGGIFEFRLGNELIKFDTSYLTIIASGAFQQLKNEKLEKNKKIGFNNCIEDTNEYKTDDFVSYGLPKEFIGRFSLIIKLNDLTKEDLKNILLQSKISSLKANIETFSKLNINVIISDEIIDEIVKKAYIQNTGARSLNKIVDELFNNATFDVLSNGFNDKMTLTFENIDGQYTLKKTK